MPGALSLFCPAGLQHLPCELLHHMFSFLALRDCIQLSFTSRALRKHLLAWAFSSACHFSSSSLLRALGRPRVNCPGNGGGRRLRPLAGLQDYTRERIPKGGIINNVVDGVEFKIRGPKSEKFFVLRARRLRVGAGSARQCESNIRKKCLKLWTGNC